MKFSISSINNKRRRRRRRVKFYKIIKSNFLRIFIFYVKKKKIRRFSPITPIIFLLITINRVSFSNKQREKTSSVQTLFIEETTESPPTNKREIHSYIYIYGRRTGGIEAERERGEEGADGTIPGAYDDRLKR